MIYKILIIQTDKNSRVLLQKKMAESRKDLDVKVISKFSEAKELLDQSVYDVIVSDHDLGDNSGFDVLKRAKNAPVIFTTGRQEVPTAVESIKLGAFDFILKDDQLNYLTIIPALINKAIHTRSEQRQLEVSKFRYDDLFENTSDLIQCVDEGGKLVYVNPAWLKTLDYKLEEVASLLFTDVVHPDFKRYLKTNFDHLKNGKDFTHVELILIGKGGKEVYVEGNISNDHTADQSFNKRAIFRNVTAHKEVQSNLAKSEKMYRLLVEESSDIFYETDYKGDFTFLNEAIEQFIGYKQEELIGRPYHILIHEDYKADVIAFYTKQFLERIATTYMEFPLINKAGNQVWVGQNVRLVYEDGDQDRIKGYAAVVRNVTERKEYENELETLSMVASRTDNYVIITDKSDAVEWVNHAFKNITGYEFSEVVHKKPESFLRGPRTDNNIAKELYNTVKVKGKTFRGELLNYTKTGEEIWLSMTVTPIYDQHKHITKYITIGNDVTDKKVAESKIKDQNRKLEEQNQQIQKTKTQLQESNEKLISINNHLEELVNQRTKSLRNTNERLVDANKELDLYVYRASHDLRGPLASLLGLAKIAQLESKEKIALEYFDRIEVSTLNLENILRKLLSVSKIKKHRLSYTHLDVDQMVKEITKTYKNFIEASNVQISFKYEENSQVYSDPYLFTIIFQNLVENAIYFQNTYPDFNSKVMVTFEISSEEQVIEVWDNGIGINEIYHERIFEMFFRVSEKSKGNGLGLFIVKLSTEKLNGKIILESEPYSFASFKVILPGHH